ncbi:hypothetical protein QMN51_23500, partial [Escherichia coli]|nr:hypothetical protein [Escherichia coli]
VIKHVSGGSFTRMTGYGGRLWQALHETIIRNHQCRSMWQLLKKVRHFMDTVSPFPGGKHGLAKV